MKLFKCIKSSKKFLVEVTKGRIYECENVEDKFITVVDDFYIRNGMDLEKFKKSKSYCELPRWYFNTIFEEVE